MTGKTSGQMFSFEVVSCLLAALAESGVTVGSRHYQLMEKLDGSKTASGFEHMFRAVKKRAAETNGQIKKGETNMGAATDTPKSRKTATTGCGKRGRKAKTEAESAEDDEESPNKKVKTEYDELL